MSDTGTYVKIFLYVAAFGFLLSIFMAALSAYFPMQMFDYEDEEYRMNQENFQQFAGDLALQYNAYPLIDVRSPGYGYWKAGWDWPPVEWISMRDGDQVGRERYYAGSPYGQIGIVNPEGVFMDPRQKSTTRLGNNVLGEWEHTGYRYQFAPQVGATRDQVINIIWYKHGNEQGLEAGVDINMFNKPIDFISADTIINGYNVQKQIGEYKFSLGDRSVYAIIKFDVDTLQANGGDYYEAFDEGGWSINIARKVIADVEDVKPDLLDTVISIVSMSNPSLPGELQFLVFILIALPSSLAVALFLLDKLIPW